MAPSTGRVPLERRVRGLSTFLSTVARRTWPPEPVPQEPGGFRDKEGAWGEQGGGQRRLGTTLSCRPADAVPGQRGRVLQMVLRHPRRPQNQERSLLVQSPHAVWVAKRRWEICFFTGTSASPSSDGPTRRCSGRSPEPVAHCGFQNAILRLSSSHCFHGSSDHRWGASVILCDHSTGSDGPVVLGFTAYEGLSSESVLAP